MGAAAPQRTSRMKWIGRIAAAIVLLLLLIYAVLAWASTPRPEHPFFAGRPDVLVMAHQGGNGLWPSNTLLAMEQAQALGVDVLEMDVHSTSDGRLVLSHDETVERLTDGSGLIKEMTLAELQELDAAYNWTDENGEHAYRGQGVRIPTLEAVFDAFPDMLMNIEIKQQAPSIVAPFCDLIRRYGKKDEVLVASFHAQTMVDFRQTCPGVPTSATEPEILPFFVMNKVFLDAAYDPVADAFQVPEYNGDLRVVTERFVTGAHGHNVDVHVWTVNETRDMQRLIDLGVDGIITDRPDRLLSQLGR